MIGYDAAATAIQLSFDELGTPLRQTTFCVFDLETTGVSPQRDAVTEIGAVKVRGGEVLGEFATLVDPGRGIPLEIVSLTGITQAMVSNAPAMNVVLPAFLEFAAGTVLVAHNAPFDTGFLRAACEEHGYPWPRPAVLCTVRLARRVLSRQEAPSCKLSALAHLFGAATTPAHRALDDALATVDVLHGLLERVGPLGVQSLEELLDFLPAVTAAQRRKRTLAAALPEAPGVYLFRGPSQEVLYVGTASNLRRRVRQYFTGSETRGRMREMVALTSAVDSVTCAHPMEAAVRELRLLAAHRPPYNRRSKNPHGGWWITLTEEAFPRLSMVRKARHGALGPFISRSSAATAVDTLLEVSGIRACNQRIPARDPHGRPCALAELGRCGAPCSGAQDVPRYSAAVAALQGLIQGSDTRLLRRLRERLDVLIAEQRFEEAAVRRDRLAALIRALARAQRLAALAALPELVAAGPDGTGGWHFAVVRHGRLAAAGAARRGVPPMPIVDAIVASAETVLPGGDPLRGSPAEEVGLVLRWLERPGTRLVRCAESWSQPSASAAGWLDWADHAAAARARYPAQR
ncbi:MAG: DEDD exonuclease domain-containing protein [Sciscionella sp.]